MADLVLLVPSRGRPDNVTRLVEACARTCRADTIIHFGFDEDDRWLADNLINADGAIASVALRMGLGAWTNELASRHLDSAWLCSIGDDMLPETDGWDEQLCEAAGLTGFAYPNDGRRDDLPECVVTGTEVVRALGWFCEPSLRHWYVDAVWRDLGAGAGCLRYLPQVSVRHLHPNVAGTGAKGDATYFEAATEYAVDLAAYQKWRMKRMPADIATVRRVNAG